MRSPPPPARAPCLPPKSTADRNGVTRILTQMHGAVTRCPGGRKQGRDPDELAPLASACARIGWAGGRAGEGAPYQRRGPCVTDPSRTAASARTGRCPPAPAARGDGRAWGRRRVGAERAQAPPAQPFSQRFITNLQIEGSARRAATAASLPTGASHLCEASRSALSGPSP
jgi:hypothetical protein